MAIRRVHGARAVAKAGSAAGAARAGEKAAALHQQRQEAQAAREFQLQLQREERAYRDAVRQQDMTLDLEMRERAKRWEIDNMELASRLDFEREEKVRQRRLDNADNALAQIDKEVQAGRMSEKEAYPLRLKYTLEKEGVDAPVSLVRPQGEGDQYGIKPYWMQYLQPQFAGTQEQQMAQNMLQEKTTGERGGTIPWYLTPKHINTSAGRQAQEGAGIFLDEEEIQDTSDTQGQLMGEFQKAAQTGQRALAKKLWDEGVRLGYWSD